MTNGFYSALDEIRGSGQVQIDGIQHALSGGTFLAPPFVREYCYLQLRMLCELIALGCLVAHGEIKATQATAIQKTYAADKIIQQLEKLHSNFYPHAIVSKILPPTPEAPKGTFHMDRLKSGFLTKAELMTLYGKCGDQLHRGPLKKVQASMTKTQPPNYSDIVGWTQKIVNLLREHHIASFDNLSHFICFLAHPPTGGGAAVAVALSPLPT